MLQRLTTQGWILLLLILAAGAVHAQTATTSILRTWTNTEGKSMQARLTGVSGDIASFELADGQTTTVPLAGLSPEGQSFIKSNATTLPDATSGTARPGSIGQPAARTWPKDIIVPPKSIDVKLVEDKPAENLYRYHSEAFEFISQDKLAGSVMIEIARIFESTRSLVDALPWGVKAEPPKDLGYFRARLYTTKEAYLKDGGLPNSGGVYTRGDRIFRVPFSSMGLELRGKTWFKKQNFNSDTLVHEITHQMMHDYLDFMPNWIAEGCAEYTEMLPYNAGTFRAGSHEKGIKDYIARQFYFLKGGLSDLGSASEHMNMNPKAWDAKFKGGRESQHRIYGYSCLLVYFFCHLDGDGNGTRFIKYFDTLTAENNKRKGYDGRFTFPNNLTPPAAPEKPANKDRREFGLEKMALLYDGRTPAQLDEDVKTAFKKIGVKW